MLQLETKNKRKQRQKKLPFPSAKVPKSPYATLLNSVQQEEAEETPKL